MKTNTFHKHLKNHLIQYHLELDTFSVITDEFHEFKALETRKLLEDNKSLMNKSELIMLCVVDLTAIEIYNNLKAKESLEFLNNQADFIDLQKAVLIAKKNIKDNPLLEKAVKIKKLSYSNLLFNSCIVEAL